MKVAIKILLSMACSLVLYDGACQDSEYHFSSRTYENSPSIGLALSGGAAHGLAHVGVIQYLDEVGVKVDYITGTSMGAVIGALHAMGYSGLEMERIAGEINWDGIINNEIHYDEVSPVEKFFHDKYPLNFVINDSRILLPQGILNTNNLELELARLFSPAVGIDQFSDLPIPFRCFGVDIEEGEVVTMKSGKLADALRASMAIPSVFSPFRFEGKWIVDGGLMRNFPVIENFDMGSDIVLGSYVGREKSDISELNNLIDILSESAFMMSIHDSKKQISKTDILFCPDVKNEGVFDFNSYKKLIKSGYESAKSHHRELMQLVDIQKGFPAKDPTIPMKIPEYIYIDSIYTSELPLADKKLTIDKFKFLPRTHMTYRMIEEGIGRITSTLNFESVKYEIIKKEEKNILYISAKPRKYRKLGINVNYFSNTTSSLILSGQIKNLFFRLSTLRATLRLSDNPAVAGDYYIRGGFNNKNWVLGIHGDVMKSRLKFYSKDQQKKSGVEWQGHIRPYLTYEFNNQLSLMGSVDFKRFDYTNNIQSQIDIRRMINSSTRFGLDLDYDSRDDRVLTRYGAVYHISAGYGFAGDDNVRYTSGDAAALLSIPVSKDYIDIEIFGSKTFPLKSSLWWTTSVNAYYKSNPSLLDGYRLGGTAVRSRQNLPFIGFLNSELLSNAHLYGRTDLRIGIFEQVSLAFVFNGMYISNKALIYSDPSRESTSFFVYGAGLEVGIKSPIGPILFDLGFNSEAQKVKGEISVGWRHFL